MNWRVKPADLRMTHQNASSTSVTSECLDSCCLSRSRASVESSRSPCRWKATALSIEASSTSSTTAVDDDEPPPCAMPPRARSATLRSPCLIFISASHCLSRWPSLTPSWRRLMYAWCARCLSDSAAWKHRAVRRTSTTRRVARRSACSLDHRESGIAEMRRQAGFAATTSVCNTRRDAAKGTDGHVSFSHFVTMV